MVDAVWFVQKDDGWGEVRERLFYEEDNALMQAKAWIMDDVFDTLRDCRKLKADGDEVESQNLFSALTSDLSQIEIEEDKEAHSKTIIYGDMVIRIRELEID